MYARLLNNANLNFERLGEKNNVQFQKIKNIEIHLHQKLEKVKNLQSDSCYDFSDYSESINSNEDDELENSQSSSIRLTNTNLKSFSSLNLIKIIGKNQKNFTLFQIKKITKILDIFACIFACIGTLLSQIENEISYSENLNNRINIVKLCTQLSKFEWNISNIEYDNFKLDYLNKEKFYSLKIKKCSQIPFQIKIPKECEILRYLILLSTLLTIPFLISSSYFDILRETEMKKISDIKSIKINNIIFLIIELLILTPFPYPKMKKYLLYKEIGKFICYPISSILSVMTFLRIFFCIKLFKHLTKYTSTIAEYVCENNVCEANIRFAYKAFQKDHPFIALIIIFCFNCICLGLSIRTFERYYWENKDKIIMDWDYIINCMWYVFVSMTTVGYGDMYACTQIGRILALVACFIGNYFVSMMMVFMTQKSSLNEKEQKSYELINRLNIREKVIDIESWIIYSYFKIYNLKLQLMKRNEEIYNNNNNNNKTISVKTNAFNNIGNSPIYDKNKSNFVNKIKINNEDLKIAIEKRKIHNYILKVNKYKKEIASYGSISFQEILFSICERIDVQTLEIKNELNQLQNLNEIMLSYSEDLMNINRLLKKSLYATKLLYKIINSKKELFDKFSNVDQSLTNIFNMEIDSSEIEFNEDEIKELELMKKDEKFLDLLYSSNHNSYDFMISRKTTNKRLKNSKSIKYFKTISHTSMRNNRRIMNFRKNQIKKLKKIKNKTIILNSKINLNKRISTLIENKNEGNNLITANSSDSDIQKFLKKRFIHTNSRSHDKDKNNE